MPVAEGPGIHHYHEAPKKIAAGLYHSASISDIEHDYLLKENLTQLYTWGRNTHAALAQGDKGDAYIPAKVAAIPGDTSGETNFYEVACGSSHTLVLMRTSDKGGHILAAGLKLNGRLGTATKTQVASHSAIFQDAGSDLEGYLTPVDLPQELCEHMVVRICCGADHSLLLTSGGVVCGWGANSEGQCGVGRREDVLAPEPLVDFPRRRTGEPGYVKHFAAGGRHSLMVTSDAVSGGSLYTWGCNQQGRLGLSGSTENQLKPCYVSAVGDTQLVSVCGGEAHSGAVDADKKLWTWGVGASGRLGLGDTVNVRTPRRVKLSEEIGVLEIAFGVYHSVALCVSMKKKMVYTWGSGEALGLLPPGDNSVVSVPRLVELSDFSDHKFSSAPVVQVAAGAYHTLLLQENGDVLAFGQGANGRLGKGSSKNQNRPVRVGPFGFALRARDAEADGKIARRLRHKSETRASKGEQTTEETRENWEIKQVACGDMHTAALTFGGDLYLWGCGESGQLGFGNREDCWLPKQLMVSSRKVTEIALGSEHSLALTRSGEVYAWGKGDSGQLGLGRNEDMMQPRKINELKDAVTIAAGEDHSAAICRTAASITNVLWTWGSTHSGKLGVPDCFSAATHPPTQVEDFRGVEEKPSPTAVVCSQYSTAVICQASTGWRSLFTCGNGWYGRLGLGNQKKENEYMFKLVDSLTDSVMQVASGADHSCAIADSSVTDDDFAGAGYLYVWGRGKCICERSDSVFPKKFPHIESKFIHVACCQLHTIATSVMGEVYAWGDNTSGQLGQLAQGEGDDAGDVMPKQSRLPPRPRLLATGPEHSISVFQDKDTYCWGNQRGGRLGLSERTPWKISERPKKVAAKWASVEAMGNNMDAAENENEKQEQASEDSSDGEVVTNAAAPKSSEETGQLRWWSERLAGLKTSDPVPCKDKANSLLLGKYTVDEISPVTGEAYVSDVRGEKKNIFDLKFHFDMTFIHIVRPQTNRASTRKGRASARSKPADVEGPTEVTHKGKVELTEFSSIIVQKKKTFPVEMSGFPQEVYDILAEHFVPNLLTQLNAWIKDFEGKGAGQEGRSPPPDNNKRMLHAIVAHQQKVTLFSTMQALVKNEPDDTKMPALQVLEHKLKKDLKAYFERIQELPAKEDRVLKLESDFQQSIVANLRFIKKLPSPDYTRDLGIISTKFEFYTELLWILQQQAFYLGTLSMMLGPDDESTFDNIVTSLFREKDNSRTMNLFLALMKVIIFKEIEQAKSLKELFHGHSAVFRLLQKFALARVHYAEVVHPIMDGNNPDSLLGKVVDMVSQSTSNQAIAFNASEYREFPQHKERLKDYDHTEVKNEFNQVMSSVRRFFRNDFVHVLKHYKLPHTILKLFTFIIQEVKKRQFPDAAASPDISADLMLHWPVLHLFVRAILIPMLRDHETYAGPVVFLSTAWRERALEDDVGFNLDKICELLEAITSEDVVQSGQDLLASIAKTTRPEMLKLVMDKVEDCFDDTDTLVTIDIYLSHFDRTVHSIQVRTSMLMRLSNLLRRNLTKLRLNQDDPVDRLCEMIGEWKAEQITAEEKGRDAIHNFTINTRWLFQEKRMVICPTSRCPVPPRFSTTSSEDGGNFEGEFLMRSYIDKSKYYDQISVIESLFYELDPLTSTTFDNLSTEMRQKQNECRAKSNFELAERLARGIKGIEELKTVGCSPGEFLQWMGDAASERMMRKRYLEDVKREISSIRWAEKRHARELVEAETQLQGALNMSRNLSIPKTIAHQAKDAGLRLKLDMVSKQMKQVDEISRKEIKNCSYSPMVTKTLQQLKRERIVQSVDPWLESVERNGGQVNLTFTLTEKGATVVIAIARQQYWRTVRSNVRYLQISSERLKDIQRSSEDDLMDLPEDNPLLKVLSVNLGSMLHKLAKS